MKKMRITLVLLMFMLATFFATEVLAATKTNMATEITENFINFSKNKDGCWFCALYKTIFCAGNAMVVAIFNALAQSCINLAAILMALWICWMVFKLFLGFSSDAAGFFANFFKALVIFVACVYTLDSRMGGGAKFIFDTFMNPLLETAADLSVSIMKAGADGEKGSVTTSLSASSNYNPAAAIQSDMGNRPFGVKVEDVPNATCPSSEQGGFSDKALQKLLQMIQAINLKLIQVMVAGKAMWTTGVNQKGLIGLNFDYMFSGIVLMLTGLYLLVVTMFKLVDAIVRLLFSCALLPLHVMFWIFPVTRRYTIAALQMFITSLCFFIVTATLLTFAIILLGGDKITEALGPLYDKNSYAELVKNFSISNGGFLLTVATSIIAGGLMDLADPLATSFGGASSGGGPGAVLRGAAGKAVGGAANLAGSVAKKGVAAVGTAGVKALGAGYKKIKKTVANRTGKGAGGAKTFGGSGAGDAAGKAAGKATGQAIEQGSKAAAKGVEAAGKATAKGVEAGGQAAGSVMQGAGNAMTQGGATLSSTGVGAILGAPMMAVGAATTAAGTGVQAGAKAAGATIEATTKAAAKGVEAAGKAAAKVAEKGVEQATKTAVNSAEKVAGSIGDKGDKKDA